MSEWDAFAATADERARRTMRERERAERAEAREKRLREAAQGLYDYLLGGETLDSQWGILNPNIHPHMLALRAALAPEEPPA